MRVVVTRAVHQAEELAGPLRARGVEVILLPLIAIAPPEDLGPLRRAAREIDDYDWIIFTSANAVNALVNEMRAPASSCNARIATIGAATREAAENRGFRVSLVPEKYVAESLVEAFQREDVKGRRILIPSAAVSRDVVPKALYELGATVDLVEAYRNIAPAEAFEQAKEVFQAPYPDWITFASPSAVDHLVTLIDINALRRVKIATIGPVTSAAVRRRGLSVTAEAVPHTIEGIVEVLCSEK